MGVEKVKAIIYLLFSFRGRISRKQWWGCGFPVSFISLPYVILMIGGSFDISGNPTFPNFLIAVLMSLPLLWILLALHIKRNHDRNRPFWWTILVLIFCMFAWVILAVLPGLRGISPILWIVVFGCLRGDAGKNRYGPPPKPLFLAADKPISNETETATSKPLDPKLLHPYTEEALRLEIDTRNESDANTITNQLYRARWNASKDPIKSGNKWTELTRKYKPMIGEKKLWAIMNLADYDQMNQRHQIHDSH